MWAAVNLGLALRNQHRLDGVAPLDAVEAIVADCGADVEGSWGFRNPRTRAMVVHGGIYLAAGLDRGWRTALLAHELGHHVQHEGSHMYMDAPIRLLLRSRQEREAQAFAGALLVGDPWRPDFDQTLHDAYERGLPLKFLFGYQQALHYEAYLGRTG